MKKMILMSAPSSAVLSGLLAIAILISNSNAFAQGSDFTYQGFLTDAGAPADGVYDLQFTIYNALEAGAQVGATTNGTETVQIAGNGGNYGGVIYDGGGVKLTQPDGTNGASLLTHDGLGGVLHLYNGDGNLRTYIGGGNVGAAVVSLRCADGDQLALIDEEDGAGRLTVYGNDDEPRVILEGNDADGGGRVTTDRLRANGDVGIGREPIANILEINGNASKSVAGNWLANSDRRIKTDIQTITNARDTLERVRLVNFRYADDYRAAHSEIVDHRYLNVIAQEFREVFPDHVKSSGEKLPDGSELLQVDTYPLTIYSAAAVQELNRELKQKQKAIEELTARLDRLEQIVTPKRDENEK
jgi:hypothetical protein